MFEDVSLHPVLPAADLERAKAWYADKLGLKPVVDDELGLEYETGGHRFGVYASQFAGTNQATAAAFRVDDVDAAVTQLRDRGVEFEDVDYGAMGKTVDGVITAPDGRKAAWFKDSEGNMLAISNR